MAEASVPVKYLDEITECPICTNVYTDPRVLPCIHTYCLRCIEGWSQERKPQDKLACPLCRKEITISTERLADELPKNLFVEKLLEVRKLSSAFSSKETLCEICEKSKSTAADKAAIYCVDCRQNMCQQCSVSHKYIRGTSSHKLVEFGEQLQPDDLLVKLSNNSCDKHRDRNLEIYCMDCKVVVCMMCYLKGHKSHEVSDVNEAAEALSREMKTDGDGIDRKTSECQELLKKLYDEENSFTDAINNIEREVTEKAEEMKKLIEQYKTDELDKLRETKFKQVKQIENVRHEIESVLMMLDSFKKYTEQLTVKGAACEIARQARGLRTRAKELMEFDVSSKLADEVCWVDVKFSGLSQMAKLKQILDEGKVQTSPKASAAYCSTQMTQLTTETNPDILDDIGYSDSNMNGEFRYYENNEYGYYDYDCDNVDDDDDNCDDDCSTEEPTSLPELSWRQTLAPTDTSVAVNSHEAATYKNVRQHTGDCSPQLSLSQRPTSVSAVEWFQSPFFSTPFGMQPQRQQSQPTQPTAAYLAGPSPWPSVIPSVNQLPPTSEAVTSQEHKRQLEVGQERMAATVAAAGSMMQRMSQQRQQLLRPVLMSYGERKKQ